MNNSTIRIPTLVILLFFCLNCAMACGFKESDSGEPNEVVATIMEINRNIVNQDARETDRTPYVSRSYNYAGLDYDGYLATLSTKTLVNALVAEIQNENITLVSNTVSLENEDIVINEDTVIDQITVNVTLRGMVNFESFMNLNIPTNTVFTGQITSVRQLIFIKDLDGMWRFIAEKNIHSDLTISGGEFLELNDFVYSPTESISPGNDLHVQGRLKWADSYRVKVDWGYEESGSDDLLDGSNFDKSFNFISSDGKIPQGMDSINFQVVGCRVSLDIIIGFYIKIIELPVIPLQNGPPL